MSANPTRKWSDSWPKEQWQLAHTLVAEAKKSGALIRMPCQVCGAELCELAKLYPEYREWMNTVLADVTAQTGKGLLFLFEPPGANIAEVWLYDPGEPPQLVETLHKPCDKPLSEALGMPAGWKETP